MIPAAAPYRPGRFYERELPCLTAVLQAAERRLDTLIIDGYVHLSFEAGKGLGTRLYETLDYTATVIGVAKNLLRIAVDYTPIFRGRSQKPLYISAIGCRLTMAARYIAAMHGPYRLPTLLKTADRQTHGNP